MSTNAASMGAQEDPTAFVTTLSERNSLDAAGMKPWHLKVTYTSPASSTSGSVEEWWEAPDHWRQEWTSGGQTSVALQKADGLFYSPGFVAAEYPVQLLVQQLLHPLGKDEVHDAKPELRDQKFGSKTLKCVMLSQDIKSSKEIPLGLFPTYCADGDELLLSQLGMTYAVSAHRLKRFQDHMVPVALDVRDGQKLVLQGTVEQLEDYAPVDARSDATGLVQLPVTTVRISGGVSIGLKVSGGNPSYPASVRERRIAGTVVLQAKIGSDGHVHAVRLVSSPDPDLSMVSIAAVQQWIYKPYVLKGIPISFLTTVTVNFR